MGSYSKGTWLFMGFMLAVMLVCIGFIEVRLPEGDLSTELMLGVTVLGYSAIGLWLYVHRTLPKPQTGSRRFYPAGYGHGRPLYDAPADEERRVPQLVAAQELKGRYH